MTSKKNVCVRVGSYVERGRLKLAEIVLDLTELLLTSLKKKCLPISANIFAEHLSNDNYVLCPRRCLFHFLTFFPDGGNWGEVKSKCGEPGE